MALPKEVASRGPQFRPEATPPQPLHEFLRRKREQAGYSIQKMADLIGVSRTMCSRFEAGQDASARVALGYMEILPGVTIGDLNALANEMAGAIAAEMWEHRAAVERIMMVDHLYRAAEDGYAAKLAEVLNGPCGIRTHDSTPKEQNHQLAVIEGQNRPRRNFKQTELPL